MVKKYERIISDLALKFGLQISRVHSAQARLPVEATPEDIAFISGLRPFTMTSAERLWSLVRAVRYVTAEGITGDFVECGVWRGGSVMAMAGELLRLGETDRRIWLYDTFTGMTSPTEADVEADSGLSASRLLSQTPVGDGDNVWCVAGREDVESNISSIGYPFDMFTLVEGDVSQTLTTSAPERLAILRLDTDWYASTAQSLEILYPRLTVGGVCILDDYGHWLGARRAVDEYFAHHGPAPYMHPIDYSGRVFIKTR